MLKGTAILCVLTATVALAQLPWREYPAQEYNNFPAPPGARAEKFEFAFGRLMYPSYGGGGRRFRGMISWREGYTEWTNDYPRADRHLMVALRRLTRLDNRSVEQPINLEDGGDVYNWPFLYVVRAGYWQLDEAGITKLRDYIARGGFVVADDIWGIGEWNGFMETMSRVLPGNSPVEIANDDPVFHTAFDLSKRYQISGAWSLRSGIPYLNGGIDPHWRGFYDEKNGRLIAAAWVNNDTGDSWEWADDPAYPEKYSALGIRIMVNHILYAMSH
jgi:hypothetical protein